MKLIAAVSPDVYCDPDKRKKIKEIIEKSGYAAAAASDDAKLIEASDIFEVHFSQDNTLKSPRPLDALAIRSPLEKHRLVYDSPTETLEPIYFWVLDIMENMFSGDRNLTKLTDNFVSSAGSSYFAEIGGRATRMQEEASKILGNVNTVLKSVLNIIYDLKEFRIRLETYDKYHNGTQSEKDANLLALKQIWLDRVDIARGTTAVKAMAQQFDYVTLIDAFMAAPNIESVTKKDIEGYLDLNDRVRRLLAQRLADFFRWVGESEKELRKRFEIEKHYLRSQVSALKLYARWVKPYLEASRKLEQNAGNSAALVTTFNTLILELTLLGKNEYKTTDDVKLGDLPILFLKDNLPKGTRKYHSCVLVDFKFRSIPQRAGQGYAFGGKADVSFYGFSLNDEELKILEKAVSEDEFKGMLSLIEGTTTQSLMEIEKDINEFLEGEKTEEEKAEEKKAHEKANGNSEDSNPFSALFSFFKPKEKNEEEKKKKEIDMKKLLKPDDRYEKVLRSQAIVGARDSCNTIFETYKKAHQMPSF